VFLGCVQHWVFCGEGLLGWVSVWPWCFVDDSRVARACGGDTISGNLSKSCSFVVDVIVPKNRYASAWSDFFACEFQVGLNI
jgi:hypothetical protein